MKTKYQNSRFYPVPPSPEVMSILYMDYLRNGKPNGLTFAQYLAAIGFTDPAADQTGMDDDVLQVPGPGGPELIAIPTRRVINRQINIKVLLIDFPDRVGQRPIQNYEDLLFSQGIYPTGSLNDYYREVSLNHVSISGSVHGWLRMPRPYSFYTNNESGTKWNSYPRNAPRMAEDAVKVAIDDGVTFDTGLDLFNEGIITALFIVHAGRGAETMHPSIRGTEIWSHKWVMRQPVEVVNGVFASIYLTVPQDCRLGVCAHELGHLVFQWQDFYDPNYDQDGMEWDGSGRWDLMAGGSYNGNGSRPAHPAALHKMQHDWLDAIDVNTSLQGVVLPAYTGKVIRLKSPVYQNDQYLLLENRSFQGFDFDLPGEGLLVWKVDESGEQFSPDGAGLSLVQADGQHDLQSPNDWNQGDAGDPFPGEGNHTELLDTGTPSTSFDGQPPSGIRLRNIAQDAINKEITLDIDLS